MQRLLETDFDVWEIGKQRVEVWGDGHVLC